MLIQKRTAERQRGNYIGGLVIGQLDNNPAKGVARGAMLLLRPSLADTPPWEVWRSGLGTLGFWGPG